MNDLQKKMLELLKEIDRICDKYDIEYYAAGGTVIGAVRHGGYIPWDDDADIYMTRKNFDRFIDAFNAEKPKDRKLECRQLNSDYPATVCRYNDETASKFCRYHIVNLCSAGLLIDILIMDPIPNEIEKQKEYLAKLNIYSDLVIPTYTFSNRNENEYSDLYELYIKKVKKVGRKEVIDELEKELFSYREEDCDNYILRWGALPIILSKEMIGRPVRYKFEDMMIPIPEDWYGYLQQLYGTDWMYVPEGEAQEQHLSIDSAHISYKNYMADVERFIDKDQAMEIYWRRKDASCNMANAKRCFEDDLLKERAKVVVALQNKALANTDNLKRMFDNKEFKNITDVFDVYLKNQNTPLFIGGMKHPYWNRLINPIYINIGDENLYYLLYSIAALGNLKLAGRILRIRDFSGGKLSERLEGFKNLLEALKNINEKFYLNNPKQALAEIEQIPNSRDFVTLKRIYWLARVDVADTAESLSNMEKELDLAVQETGDPEISKAYADLLYRTDRKEEALKIYEWFFRNSRNGLLWADIESKTGLEYNDDEEAVPQESVRTDEQEVAFALLKEIDQICNREGIDYCLNNYTAVGAFRYGAFYNTKLIPTVIMSGKGAKKFIKAVEETKPKNRKLVSMANTPKCINFIMRYCDTETTFLPLARIDEWKDAGICVVIEILEGKNAVAKGRLKLLNNLRVYSNCEKYDLPNLGGHYKLKRMIATVLAGIMGRKRLSASVFDKRLNMAAKENGKIRIIKRDILYRSNAKTTLKKYSIDIFKERDTADLYGYAFPVPKDIERYIEKRWYTNVDFSEVTAAKYNISLTKIISAKLSYKELTDIIDMNLINSIDWKAYYKSKQALMSINKQVKSYWKIAIRAEDRISLWQKYMPIKEELLEQEKQKNYEKVAELLVEYDQRASYYLKHGLSLSFDNEIFDVYCRYLERCGRKKYRARLIELLPDEYREPVKIIK